MGTIRNVKVGKENWILHNFPIGIFTYFEGIPHQPEVIHRVRNFHQMQKPADTAGFCFALNDRK